jgi:hypothetical protein
VSESVFVAAQKAIFLSPVPRIFFSGVPVVGNVLIVQPGVWDTGVSLSFQWLRNSVPVVGATDLGYRLTTADIGASIEVMVTGSKAGFVPTRRLSSSVSVSVTANMALTPIPRITGTPRSGETLTVVTGSWDSGVSFAYQWSRNGAFVPGATGVSHVLSASDAGASIAVNVTGSKLGFNSVTRLSSAVVVTSSAQTLVLTPNPVISGVDKVGSSLSVVVGAWDSGVSLSYQWLRNGAAVPGATGNSYLLSSADLGVGISVTVTGTKPGFSSVAKSSSQFIVRANLVLTPIPTVSGVPSPGNSLSVVPGVWDSGVLLSYQWLRNGAAVPDATGTSYVLTSADAGASFAVRVTGTKPGAPSIARLSLSVVIAAVPKNMTLTPVPLISGFPKVGGSLQAVVGAWDSGVSLSYQWLRNGVAVPGATLQIYQVTQADSGAAVTVSVSGTRLGFNSVTRVSASLGIAVNQIQVLTPIPQITGVPLEGNSLSVIPGVWDSGVSLSYQWMRNDVAVRGANGSNYVLSLGDRGARFGVTVTGSKAGFANVSRSSAPLFILSNMTLTPVPTISGVASLGNSLSVIAGSWGGAVSLSYQWLRNGSAVAGATGTSYILSSADLGARISVSVTGTLAGYLSVTKVSAETVV